MRADCLPHARVSILVDGAALPEYSTEGGDGKTATTFVEAVPGATFTVELELETQFFQPNPNDKINFVVYLDGEYVRSTLTCMDYRPVKNVMDGAREQTNGGCAFRVFVFAQHETTEGQAHSSLVEKLASLGEIKVELKWCRETGKKYEDHVSSFKGIGEDPLPEKATKGRSISNHAKLGDPVKIAKIHWLNVKYPYGLAPIATYKFQYRSRRDLEIEGILQRPPSPAPPVKLEERDPADLTPDEAREQLRLLRAREAANNIKRESQRENRKRERSVILAQENGNEDNNDGDDDEVTITAEWDRRKRARASAEGAEVVDLTEED